jgi:hypothetical protein
LDSKDWERTMTQRTIPQAPCELKRPEYASTGNGSRREIRSFIFSAALLMAQGTDYRLTYAGRVMLPKNYGDVALCLLERV